MQVLLVPGQRETFLKIQLWDLAQSLHQSLATQLASCCHTANTQEFLKGMQRCIEAWENALFGVYSEYDSEYTLLK